MGWRELIDSKEIGRLGFKELDCFNEALTAKEGWRLLRNTLSLVGKVMKAKYYTKGNFLNAKLGHNPSRA